MVFLIWWKTRYLKVASKCETDEKWWSYLITKVRICCLENFSVGLTNQEITVFVASLILLYVRMLEFLIFYTNNRKGGDN